MLGMGWTNRQRGGPPIWGEEEETLALPSGNTQAWVQDGKVIVGSVEGRTRGGRGPQMLRVLGSGRGGVWEHTK